MHDIIDNRNQKLVDHIHSILPQTNRARFAVGYLFLSGLQSLGKKLENIEELRLLIGNTTNRETVEMLAEGYRRLELVDEQLEKTRYARKSDQREWTKKTAENLKESMEIMDQTDEGEELIQSLIRLIEEKRLKVKVFTKGRLHAKAYIFDYTTPNPGNAGIAVVGSSNLTLSGLSHNTELNVLVHDNASPLAPNSGNHSALVDWFDELWGESQDFDTHLMNELQQSWAAKVATPYDIYMKTLYMLVKDRLDGGDDQDILWDDDITEDLADFQKVAVRQAIQMIRDNNGCFVADVVGLGKSFIGAGIVKHFQRTEHARTLIICPKPLEEMWINYNEKYELDAQILPMSLLQADSKRGVDLLTDPRYKNRNFVLIDESHNFRHHTSQRYEVLQDYLSTGKRVCLLTATPRNSRALDVYNQIKLFHPEDLTALPIDPPDLKEYFGLIESNQRRLQDILSHLLIRRTRRHILRWYGYASDSDIPLRTLTDNVVKPYLKGTKQSYVLVGGKKRSFPKRELESLRYSIEDTYAGLYQELRDYLGGPTKVNANSKQTPHLTYARYGIWKYVKKQKQNVAPYTELKRAGINLRGLIRTSLFKRFESSVEAFRKSLQRMIRTHRLFLAALDSGHIPAGDDADALLGRAGRYDDDDLLSTMERVTGKYNTDDFHMDSLKQDVSADLDLLQNMFSLVEPITPEQDDKLQTFLQRLNEPPTKGNKVLIFTQYSDTAEYVFENLNPNHKHDNIEIITGGDKSKSRVVRRFSPKSNSEITTHMNEAEIRLLVATDVLAEGLNLQDCNVVLNYDIHWNPVRLIQRFGRIDRIGTEHDRIYGLNFLPETALEKELRIHEVLANRIREIHETIGEDAAILDATERVNEESMYAIYASGDSNAQIAWEEEDLMDLNEAEEFFRKLESDSPEEYERIVNLRDGIRSTKAGTEAGTYAFCQAGRYSKLYFQPHGSDKTITDVPYVLKAIVASPHTAHKHGMPSNHNNRILAIRSSFAGECKRLEAMKDHTIRMNVSQRYILRELKELYAFTDNDDKRAQISEMERAYRMAPSIAIKKQLNRMRRNATKGDNLLRLLIELYHQHSLKDRLADKNDSVSVIDIPRVVCSEALY